MEALLRPIKRALISVSDKSGVVEFAKELEKRGVEILSTGGTAKFYSVLNTESFMKNTSIIAYSQKALQAVHQDIIAMAEAEGLTAHANAIKVRFNS